jgi:cysteine-rich repeat protein
MRTSSLFASLIVSIGFTACMSADIGGAPDESAASGVVGDRGAVVAPTSERTVDQPTACCGNGVIEPGEQCDDGNTIGGDGCSSTCQWQQPPV